MLTQRITHHTLNDIGKIVGGGDEESSLFSVGSANLVDPGEDERPSTVLFVSGVSQVGLTPIMQNQYSTIVPQIEVLYRSL